MVHDRDHPQTRVPIVDSHKTKTAVKIPTVFTIKFLDETSKPLEGVEVEVRQSNSSVRVKTDKNGTVKVRRSAEGSIGIKLVPPDQGNPSDWSSKPTDKAVDTPKPFSK